MDKIMKIVDLSFDETIKRLTENLKKEDFGIITDIDVKKTMKEKIGFDMNDYRILGACNPKIASNILEFDKEMGRNLPCSIAVYRDKSKTIIIAKNPLEIVSGINDKRIIDAAQMVSEKIKRAVMSV